YSDGAHKTDDGNLDMYFRYRFNLASTVNPATFAVKMDFYADNEAAEIWVNGVAQSSQPNGAGQLPQKGNPPISDPYSNYGFTKGSAVSITLDNSWRRCENEIIVHVQSGPGYIGFLAQNSVEVKPDADGCDCECNCKPLTFPDATPCIEVKWGDSKCDCIE